jgi:hypothetical protein
VHSVVGADDGRTAECERELEKGHRSAPTGAKTAVHDPDVRIRAAELCVRHDETDGPICDPTQDDEEKQSREEPRATHGVGQTWNQIAQNLDNTEESRTERQTNDTLRKMG